MVSVPVQALPSEPEQKSEPLSVQERGQAQSYSPLGCQQRACTMPEPEPTSGLPGRAQEPTNVPTEAGLRAWLPEQGLPGGPGPFSEPEHGAAEVRHAAGN